MEPDFYESLKIEFQQAQELFFKSWNLDVCILRKIVRNLIFLSNFLKIHKTLAVSQILQRSKKKTENMCDGKLLFKT